MSEGEGRLSESAAPTSDLQDIWSQPETSRGVSASGPKTAMRNIYASAER